MANITVLQLMDMIEKYKSIKNYQSRWRELRSLLELQEYAASQQPLAPDVCPVCLGKKLVQTKSRGVVNCASCNGTGQRR